MGSRIHQNRPNFLFKTEGRITGESNLQGKASPYRFVPQTLAFRPNFARAWEATRPPGNPFGAPIFFFLSVFAVGLTNLAFGG